MQDRKYTRCSTLMKHFLLEAWNYILYAISVRKLLFTYCCYQYKKWDGKTALKIPHKRGKNRLGTCKHAYMATIQHVLTCYANALPCQQPNFSTTFPESEAITKRTSDTLKCFEGDRGYELDSYRSIIN